MPRVFVTGIGIISALGMSAEQNRTALIRGASGLTNLEMFQSKYSSSLLFGEIKISTESLKDKLNAHDSGITRTTLLALHAFNEAIASAGLSDQEITHSLTSLIHASTVGGMCLTDQLYRDANALENGSEYLASYDCASAAIYLQQRFNMQGIVNTINTACSSSANAIMFGARLMHHGIARRAIVGGSDSLAKFTINGFNALHILSPEHCAPFDRDRQGLNLGEGAAFLVLENEDDARGKTIYAELTGYGNSNDAHHPSSLSDNGDGPYLSMQTALHSAKLDPQAIDFINAHGTATENNDLVESVAMARLFGTQPPFASTKANTGHTLGASGAIEAVFSIFNLYNNEYYPSLNFKNAMPETGAKPVVEYKQTPIMNVMSNSFGFGGNCSSLIFSKRK